MIRYNLYSYCESTEFIFDRKHCLCLCLLEKQAIGFKGELFLYGPVVQTFDKICLIDAKCSS